jgi:hypothetical protein
MKKGTCKLCLKERSLCDSHYMPGALYKHSRAPKLKNPHPIVLTGTKPKRGTGQVRDYLLCAKCENRFRVRGETWVLSNIPHDYGKPFALRAAALETTPAVTAGDVWLIAGRTTPAFDIDKLIYFAASIFWRGAAHDWPQSMGLPVDRISLGAHLEPLRAYLNDEASFPADLFITVMLYPYETVPPGFILPHESSVPGGGRYWFYVTGLGFVLDFGDKVRPEIKSHATNHSPEQFITVSNQFGEAVRERTREMMGDTSELTELFKEIAAVRAREAKNSKL